MPLWKLMLGTRVLTVLCFQFGLFSDVLAFKYNHRSEIDYNPIDK